MLLVQKQFLQNVFFIKFRTIYTFSVYGEKKKNKCWGRMRTLL